jgi:hypothetical protein
MIRSRRKVRKPSWRWEIVDDSFQRHPDGRLVALNNAKGSAWYREQTLIMVRRQKNICGICHGTRLMHGTAEWSATFQHGGGGRGMGGAKRDDRIDQPGTCAAHWKCNGELGSRRISTVSQQPEPK